jgi:hypothetical protein
MSHHDTIKHCKSGQDCHEVNHLCQIAAKRDIGRIRELVKDSQFYCKNCGRAARDEANLCNPSNI